MAAGYAITNWDALLATTYPAPAGALIQQVVTSKGGSFAILLCVVLPSFAGNMSYTSANLRLVHGFAATGAREFLFLYLRSTAPANERFIVPWQKWLMKMDKDGEIPDNLLGVTAFVSFLWGCIYLASSVGFTIALSSANLLYALGYIPLFVGYVATKGRHMGREGYFKLPKVVSLAASTFTLLYLCLTIAIYSIPPTYPVTAKNMNFSPVIGGSVTVLLILTWRFYADARYIGYPELVEAVVLDDMETSKDASVVDGKSPVACKDELA